VKNRELTVSLVIVGAMLAVSLMILALTPGAVDWAFLKAKPHAPSVTALKELSPLVTVHLATVGFALVGGIVQFVLPKGTRFHRAFGWMWVLAMTTTAVATLFIRDMNPGSFSPIHIFSAMTLVSLPIAVWVAHTHRAGVHARIMIGIYVGLLIAGATAVAPGRLLWSIFFG
jgi:uncharacterized membrane protein